MPRPKSFDPAQKLEEAVTMFWREGYASTSIPALEKFLNINRFSIYDTFGDKRSLFLQVLARYTELLVQTLVRPLEEGTDGLADLRKTMARFRNKFGNPNAAKGCLLVNTATELGSHDDEIAALVGAYFERLEQGILACLMRARDSGEIEGTNATVRARARLLRSAMCGTLVELRLAQSARDVGPTFRSLEAHVRDLAAT